MLLFLMGLLIFNTSCAVQPETEQIVVESDLETQMVVSTPARIIEQDSVSTSSYVCLHEFGEL
jgi:hypothetical protein